MNSSFDQFLQDGVIDKNTVQQLKTFVSLFQTYNQHTNLSAIRKEEAIWQKHIIDSLMVLKFEHLNGKLLDIGTGGGMPGIPLAITRKSVDVTLIDSIGKKIKACEHFISELQIENVHAIQARAERLGQEKVYAGTFDVVVSRATAYLPTILAWSEQFMKPGGKIILYKTPSEAELVDGETAAKKLGLHVAREHSYNLDGQERKILVYAAKDR